ncbi:MAG: ATP-binding cassette domain-containing protein [Clostridium sp.]|nr:ATP-binding cassette domain-containing protein [Prevotella sp.]MCM1429265.1 ATP-binding cassette domain-containing protein [Clostridium sp.]MCM1475702.1 ATP-binding cassette domain-containing protein [Muribaculaceae bacterium]
MSEDNEIDKIEEYALEEEDVQTSESVKHLVEYKGVEVERADKLVLRNVDFTLDPGEFVYLVGRVGSGKSSLMKTMYADVPLTHGDKAKVMGFDLLNIKRKQIPYLRRKIGIVFQDFQLLTDRSVSANLRFVLEATGWKSRTEIQQRVEEVLTAVGMDNKSYKMPHELSGGEQQRIVIARALLNKPDLILADEPTGNLDPQTGYNIVTLLHELSHAGQAILMATHNLQLVDDFPARTVRCRDKQLE